MLTNLVIYANLAILILFFAAYVYQAFYLLVGLFKKEKVLEPKGTPGRYAVLIPARNEEAVIDKLGSPGLPRRRAGYLCDCR